MICYRVSVDAICGDGKTERLVMKMFESKDEAEGFYSSVSNDSMLFKGLPASHISAEFEEMYQGQWVTVRKDLISLAEEDK